jgi:para-nitrobenzyl esterase
MGIMFLRNSIAVLSILVAGAWGPCEALAASTEQSKSPFVQAPDGAIQGLANGDIESFRGIPYAAPPTGERRWKPPVPNSPWTGTLQATEYGNSCPQLFGLGVFAGPPSFTEDCLYLNVVRPKNVEASKDGKRPVLVWIHGGGLFDGAGRDYDGSAMARENVIVVTFNYRLGLLGFLAHPALAKPGEPSANYGFLDQQMALRWVQRNIAAFGGDPSRVTIAGQSSGSAGVVGALISPLAKGLMSGAILQSGWSVHPAFDLVSMRDAEDKGMEFAKAAGCGGTGAEIEVCMRALSVEQVLTLQGTPVGNGPYTNPGGGIIDGVVIEDQSRTAFETGRFNKVPIMNGLTRDENSFFVMANEYYSGRPLSWADHQANVRAAFPTPDYPTAAADKVLAKYGERQFQNASEANVAYSGDPINCGLRDASRMFAKHVPLFAYEFNDRGSPSYFPDGTFRMLAYHTADILYVFPGFRGGNLGRPTTFTPDQAELSREMIGYWTNFVKSGNPNGGNVANWPSFNPRKPLYLSHDNDGSKVIAETELEQRHQCQFWEALVPTKP